MSDVKLSIQGLIAIQKRVDAKIEELKRAKKQALKVEAELIMTRSKKEFVPVDLGTLRASGMVGNPVEVGDNLTVTLSYGGAAAAYATAIHEHPSSATPPSWEGKELTFTKPNTGHKYLERPLNEAQNGLLERIAKRIDLSKNHDMRLKRTDTGELDLS